MHQIPLPVSISEYMTFETFYLSSNKAVIDSIKDDKNKLIWIAGLQGSGKTTSAAKMGLMLKNSGKKVLGKTFYKKFGKKIPILSL